MTLQIKEKPKRRRSLRVRAKIFAAAWKELPAAVRKTLVTCVLITTVAVVFGATAWLLPNRKVTLRSAAVTFTAEAEESARQAREAANSATNLEATISAIAARVERQRDTIDAAFQAASAARQGTSILSNGLEQTRSAISSLAPEKQPIRTITASAKLGIRGITNVVSDKWKISSDRYNWLGVATLELGLASAMQQPPFRGAVRMISRKVVTRGCEIGYCEVLLEFEIDQFDSNWSLRSGTAGDLNEWNALRITPDFVEPTLVHRKKIEIMEGSVTVTVNSTLQREFPIPAQFCYWGGISSVISKKDSVRPSNVAATKDLVNSPPTNP